MDFLKSFLRNEDGSNAMEYGLIVGLISLALVAGATVSGTSINTMFNFVGTTLADSVATIGA
jgi:pilus assembly protein Flp/PilA